MPSKNRLKCFFGCKIDGPLHHFPKYDYITSEKFEAWKAVLDEKTQGKSNNYIYNSVRICNSHFEEQYKLPSGQLTRNAVPNLNIMTEHQFFTTPEQQQDVSTDIQQEEENDTVKEEICISSEDEEGQDIQEDPISDVINLEVNDVKLTETIQCFKSKVKNSTILPPYWFYVEKLRELEFMRVDYRSEQITNHIRLNEDLSVTVINTNNLEFTLENKMTLCNDIYNFLISVEKWPLCVGTQIERKMYSADCKGVIFGDEAYKRKLSNPRCKSCRVLRNILKRNDPVTNIFKKLAWQKRRGEDIVNQSKRQKEMDTQSSSLMKIPSEDEMRLIKCCVTYCESSSKTKNITFHKFPTESTLRTSWLETLGKDKSISSDAVVCSKHFKSADFYMTMGKVKKLRGRAIPLTVQVCMICLDTESELRPLSKYNLEQAYTNITGMPLTDDLNFPQTVCPECAQRLINCDIFRVKTLRAHSLLLGLVKKYELITSQTIELVDRVDDKFASNLDKKHYKPDHCDLYIVESDEEDKNIDMKKPVDNNKVTDIKYKKSNNSIFKVDTKDENSDEDTKNHDNDCDEEYLYDDYDDSIKSVNESDDFLSDQDEVVCDDDKLLGYDRDVSDTEFDVKTFTSSTDNDKDAVYISADYTSDDEDLVMSNDDALEVLRSVNNNRSGIQGVNVDKKYISSIKEAGNLRKEIRKEVLKSKVKKGKSVSVDLNNDNKDNLKNVDVPIRDLGIKVSPKSKGDAASRNKIDVEAPRNKVDVGTTRPPETKVVKKREPVSTEWLDSFQITALSPEEQWNEFNKRNESANFKHSYYKCQFCYKGFQHSKPFNRHMLHHTDKFGLLECEVCKLRYKDAFRLRKHVNDIHSTTYTCLACSYVTTHKYAAFLHYRWHLGTKYTCPHCGEHLDKYSTYMSHIRIKHPSGFACAICGYSFIGQKGINQHMSLKHRFDNLQNPSGPTCHTCDIRFASKAAYDKHLEVSSLHNTKGIGIRNDSYGQRKPRIVPGSAQERGDSSPFTCEQCGVLIENYRLYTHHFRVSHPGKTRTKYAPTVKVHCLCELCGRLFKTPSALKYHMSVHTGAKFVCDICKKSFDLKWRLAIHMNVHSERPRRYQCPICEKSFAHLSNKRRHMLLHSGARPFKCQICDKMFSSSSMRTVHVEHVHLKKPWPPRKPQGPGISARTSKRKRT